jgi:hypothetical protein
MEPECRGRMDAQERLMDRVRKDVERG